MAIYRLGVKNGHKGTAARHSRYITREGYLGDDDNKGDLIATEHGNMPTWANGKPVEFWRNADKHERENGAAYREYELTLPLELTREQNKELVNEFVKLEIRKKPYEFAIHEPTAALGGVPHPHAHVMFSDRQPDSIERPPEQFFSRYNATHPESGGCRKDSGGKDRIAMKERLETVRKTWAQLQNVALEKHGHAARVDHRSYKEQGIGREPERHLGQARIRNMSEDDKARYIDARPARP